MRRSAWRITKLEHAAEAFTGDGARLYGGRWNSPGTTMVYTAQSRALAALEMLVHLESAGLLQSYAICEVVFEDSYLARLDRRDLPADWRNDPIPASTQAYGDRWLAAEGSAVLMVPSVLIPEEENFLLNPRHRHFSNLEFGEPVSFAFDSRLARR